MTGAGVATVGGVTAPATRRPRTAAPALDEASRQWLSDLRAGDRRREEAVARLHELLVNAARFEVRRRRAALAGVDGEELERIAVEAAGDALLHVLRRLDDFRGLSRFTTWAYKFALYEAAVKLRRRAWHGHELPLEPEGWDAFSATGPTPEAAAEQKELLSCVRDGLDEALTRHQREVLVALALNGVPIDVLAERLGTTRGALYKTLHDARRKLRGHLAARGLVVRAAKEEGT
jgi:RNA polymerase sigma-70 factor (ECF subfamily)